MKKFLHVFVIFLSFSLFACSSNFGGDIDDSEVPSNFQDLVIIPNQVSFDENGVMYFDIELKDIVEEYISFEVDMTRLPDFITEIDMELQDTVLNWNKQTNFYDKNRKKAHFGIYKSKESSTALSSGKIMRFMVQYKDFTKEEDFSVKFIAVNGDFVPRKTSNFQIKILK